MQQRVRDALKSKETIKWWGIICPTIPYVSRIIIIIIIIIGDVVKILSFRFTMKKSFPNIRRGAPYMRRNEGTFCMVHTLFFYLTPVQDSPVWPRNSQSFKHVSVFIRSFRVPPLFIRREYAVTRCASGHYSFRSSVRWPMIWPQDRNSQYRSER